MDRGILVMTEPASIVTVADVLKGLLPPVYWGAVKVFGCQSSIKKPIVEARGGSIAGTTTTVSSSGPGGTGAGLLSSVFLHAATHAVKQNQIKYRDILYFFEQNLVYSVDLVLVDRVPKVLINFLRHKAPAWHSSLPQEMPTGMEA